MLPASKNILFYSECCFILLLDRVLSTAYDKIWYNASISYSSPKHQIAKSLWMTPEITMLCASFPPGSLLHLSSSFYVYSKAWKPHYHSLNSFSELLLLFWLIRLIFLGIWTKDSSIARNVYPKNAVTTLILLLEEIIASPLSYLESVSWLKYSIVQWWFFVCILFLFFFFLFLCKTKILSAESSHSTNNNCCGKHLGNSVRHYPRMCLIALIALHAREAPHLSVTMYLHLSSNFKNAFKINWEAVNHSWQCWKRRMILTQ